MTMNDWIPTALLNPPSEWVLMCVWRRGYPEPDVNIGTFDEARQQWRYRSGRRCDETVSHWMKLPAPPATQRARPEQPELL